MTGRTTATRIHDALGRLATEPNVWIATASPDGVPHLVPLSLAWIDNRVVVATPTNSITVRNVIATGRARIALDSADQVVVMDTDVECVDLAKADPVVADAFASRVGWDPRVQGAPWTLLTMTLRRVQSWNDESEGDGRTIMRDGVWVEA